MTVITKASDMVRKSDQVINVPLVDDAGIEEERLQPPRFRHRTRVWVYRSQCNTYLVCLAFFTALLLIAGIILGLVFFSNMPNNGNARYRGYCSIPMDILPQLKHGSEHADPSGPIRIPLHWSSDPDLAILSNMDARTTSEVMNSLFERFEIDDNVERISVVNSGRNVEFIHDFNNNASGIVDSKRCYILALDQSVILNPNVFVMNIARGSQFDVSGVRRRLRAVLPPARLPPAALLAEACRARPVYRLDLEAQPYYRVDSEPTNQSDHVEPIRKRSAEEPAPHFKHFAGKHIQEISISNLDELLKYEEQQQA